jgi:hypothetical protein
MIETDKKPPAVDTGAATPTKKISSDVLRALGGELSKTFDQYAADRRLTEIKWMKNLRQYLGIYDPEVESELGRGRSRAYPRITRVKCISVLSRVMNLMFPGNERNWELNASPSAEMDPKDVEEAVQQLAAERQKEGVPVEMTMEFIDAAVNKLATSRAYKLCKLIDDQLQEIGGDQTLDYISLNRKVVQSGILYGLGVLRGPYVRTEQKTKWGATQGGGFEPQTKTIYKPQYDFLPVWDFYPDMSAKALPGEGYFTRLIMGRSELRRLADRPDFFGDQIKSYLRNNGEGNYKAREFETELRTMGTKANISDGQKQEPQSKYEVLVWNGPVSAQKLEQLGVDVADSAKADDIDAEIWLVDGNVIKADINAWRKLGVNVRTVHCFVFDEDDSSPIGNGLPNVVRDSQLSIAAATRMMLDNASVTCGPNLELNLSLLRQDQDLTAIEPYKVWYRDDDCPTTASFPAVRKVDIDGHLDELKGMVEMFSQFADAETFVGPATGGDMEKMPSEPMRTAAGASMLRGDAALPFKDIIRNFDFFTQSVILSLVQFNRKFNPGLAPAGDYNVIARGATSLIAKEVRGMQLDLLAQTLTEEERDHIDERKFVEQRFAVRDMSSLLVSEEEAERRKAQRQQMAAMMAEFTKRMQMAEERKTLAEAFKNITQGQKNAAAADAATANTALSILEMGLDDGEEGSEGSGRAAND